MGSNIDATSEVFGQDSIIKIYVDKPFVDRMIRSIALRRMDKQRIIMERKSQLLAVTLKIKYRLVFPEIDCRPIDGIESKSIQLDRLPRFEGPGRHDIKSSPLGLVREM
jgi:hypothetical protein